jgi:hypothetical protein
VTGFAGSSPEAGSGKSLLYGVLRVLALSTTTRYVPKYPGGRVEMRAARAAAELRRLRAVSGAAVHRRRFAERWPRRRAVRHWSPRGCPGGAGRPPDVPGPAQRRWVIFATAAAKDPVLRPQEGSLHENGSISESRSLARSISAV